MSKYTTKCVCERVEVTGRGRGVEMVKENRHVEVMTEELTL